MEDRTSAYRFYSLGIVVTTKPEGTDDIEVQPFEEFSFVNGLIKDAKTDLNINLPDHKGVSRQDKVTGKKTLIATWAPFSEGNRSTSPDVVANETVIILRVADTQKYFWTTVMREPSLRRKETVLYSYSNLPKGMDPYDKDSSYWMEWDTRRGKVQIHTASNDGEPYKFDITIDAAQGNVSIEDDVGNYILMDSKNDRLSLTSVAGANIDLDKGHIKGKGITIDLVADESIKLTAGTSISIEAGSTVSIDAGASINMTAPTISQVGAGGVSITAGGTKMSMEGSSVSIEGDTTQRGNYRTEGNVTMNGGDIVLTGGTITANGEDLTIDRT